jgi:cell division protease FtsH
MPVNKDPKQPRWRQITGLGLWLVTFFLLLNLFLPNLFGSPIPKEPYSMFIHRVQDQEVVRASVGQDEIRYQVKDKNGEPGEVYVTTPIFDLQLPQVLEDSGVEFAAVPPPKGQWFTGLLGWVIPPLIFIAVWRFFMTRNGGGPQGALSIGKSKAKVYVEGESDKITFDDVAGVDEAKTELVEIVDFLKTPSDLPNWEPKFPKGCCWSAPPARVKP